MMKLLLNKILLFIGILFYTIVSSQDIKFTDEEKEFIKNHPVIEFGYEPNWPPYEIYEEGEYRGIIGDYVKILNEQTGIVFKPIPNITWDETLKKLKTGEVKTSVCVGVTEERSEYLNFTKPYISSFMVIITTKDYGFVGGLEYLKGKTVSIPKNYYTGELLKQDHPGINLKYTDGIYEALKLVSIGEADAFVGNLMVASYYIEHLGLSNLKVAAPTDYDKSHISLAANKAWPELITISQKVFDNISFQEKNSILQKWINVRFEHGVDIKMIWKISIYSLVIVIIIIGGFLFWNEALKKEIKQRTFVESELAESLKEISTQNNERKNLLNEIHHRIKNNLHMVSGLLKLQALEAGNKEVENHLNEAVERVTSIALVHDKIYKSEDTKNLSVKDFIEMLTEEITASFALKNSINVIVNGDFNLKNTNPLPSLALIMNELLTNSLKYAFKNTENAEIRINLKRDNETVFISYSDNGKWRKPSSNIKTFGVNLIEIFTEQMEGKYTREIADGTKYQFEFSNFYSE